MAVVRKKQDDKNLKILRELVTSGGGNRQCFDCGQKGPTYVNMTIGSFVCTRCSGVLRGLTPPHRVKSISMATFTPEEIDFLKGHGNDLCAKTWLGLWDPKRVIHQDQRELMIDKYERKRYYLEPASPLKSLTTTTTTTTPPKQLSNSNTNISNGSSSNTINNNNNLNNNNLINNNNFNNTNCNSINNGSIKNSLDNNNFNNVTLTPPSSLRITANGTLGGCNGNNDGIGIGISGGGGGTVIINNSNNSHHHRQNHRYNFQNHFTPNENFSQNGGNSFNSSALMNGFNGIAPPNSSIINNQVVANKNSLNVISSMTTAGINSDKSHGFTPDSDFVADFGSANIFNSTTNNPMNGLKIQSQQQQLHQQQQQQQQQQHHHQHLQNANGISNAAVGKSTIVTNGTTTATTQANGFAVNGSNLDVINANENFADFDHAPIIYNAAAYQFKNNNSSNNVSKHNNYFLTTNTSNNNLNQTVQTPFSNSIFSTNFNNNNNLLTSNNNLNNFQFQNGINTSTATYNSNGSSNNNSITSNNKIYNTTCLNSTNNNNGCSGGGGVNGGIAPNSSNSNNHYVNISAVQWNLWQQFQSQWPFSSSSSTSTSLASSDEQNNRWSLPMSNSTSNSISSSATFNSNSSINSTPPADRYAALKDLDEQLRESKAAAAVDTFSNSVQASSQSNNVNPFKTLTQQPTQSQQIVNPFQAATTTQFNQANNIFGNPQQQQQQQQQAAAASANAFNMSTATINSAFGSQQPQQHQQQSSTIGGFNNGYNITLQQQQLQLPLNGCNLHFGIQQQQQQQIAAGSLKNPFATSSLNSNNPFL